ncbi:MAG: hypothetical protein AB1331_01720 [Bacillota bacterium]
MEATGLSTDEIQEILALLPRALRHGGRLAIVDGQARPLEPMLQAVGQLVVGDDVPIIQVVFSGAVVPPPELPPIRVDGGPGR